MDITLLYESCVPGSNPGRETKQCTKCGEFRILEEFTAKRGGRNGQCKTCTRVYSRMHYAANRDYYKKKARRNTDYLRVLVAELKSKPCLDCGASYPSYVMHFDHLGDKLGNVATMVNEGSRRKLLAEIQKCEVVCANCHAERTHRRSVE